MIALTYRTKSCDVAPAKITAEIQPRFRPCFIILYTYIHTYIQYIHTTCIIYQNRKDSKTVHLLFALLYHLIWNMCTELYCIVCMYVYMHVVRVHIANGRPCIQFARNSCRGQSERNIWMQPKMQVRTYVCMYEYMVHTVCVYWALKAKARAESYLYGGGISAVYETPECLYSERMRHYFHVFVAYFEQLFSFLQLQHKAMQEPSCWVRSASAPGSFPLSESR